MKTHAGIAALILFFDCGVGGAYGQSASGEPDHIHTGSPWAAHIDVAELRDSPLAEFLGNTLDLDQLLPMQNSLKDKLRLDSKTIESATFLGVGKKLRDTAVLLRGKFETIDLNTLPDANGSAEGDQIRIFEQTQTNEPPLFLARHSAGELVAGTSLEAAENGLSLLATKRESWDEVGLSDHARTKLSTAIVSLSLDIRRIGVELEFEAEFSQSIQRAWLLAGTHGEDVKLTLLIESNDTQELNLLREQLNLLTMMAISQKDAPAEWLQMTQAIKVETEDGWMTAEVIAPPAQLSRFLQSLTPLFEEEVKPATPTEAPEPSD